MTLSLADLAAKPNEHFDLELHPSWSDLFDLRRYLQIGLTDLMSDWDSHTNGPLRLTKGRIRTTAICPAQVLTEVDPFSINFNIAVGIVCDAAAGILALHPTFPSPDGWYHHLKPSLSQEHPHLVEFVDDLGSNDRTDFDHVVDDLCGSLPELLGDIRPHRPTVHHRIAAEPVTGVLITGEVDIGIDARFDADGHHRGRILAEVKSGGFNPRISDELAHYGLITSLRQLPVPDTAIEPTADDPVTMVGCSVSLGDLGVTPIPLGTEILETAARRLLETTSSLVDINDLVAAGDSPPTNPGNHCRWCRRVAQCPDAPDLVLAELSESLRPLTTVGFDVDFDDSRFDGDGFTEQEAES